MTLNIPNLDKLIAHLEAQPPDRINMGFVLVEERHGCGTAGCIEGHALLLWTFRTCYDFADILGIPHDVVHDLITPANYHDERSGIRRYPAHRVIATLKRLRDRFLATGEIVVDWGAEPSAGDPWAAPRATA